MKLTLVVIACLAVAGIHAAGVHRNTNPVDNAFLRIQRFLLEIVHRVEDPLLFEEWIKIGDKFITDKSKYSQYDDRMEYFYGAYRSGRIMRRGEFFTAMGSRSQFYQAFGLFHYFFYANDWDTLMRNIAWARLNVNEGMFVYALTLTVAHRPDMKGLVLPSIYEIFPQFFFPSKFVLKAEKFNWDIFNRQIMLEKELYDIYNQDVTGDVYGKRLPMRDWKMWQWWKLMGLDEKFYLEEKTVLRDNIEEFSKNPKYQNLLADVKVFYMPVDYTRDIQIFNEDTKLSYFTEDIGWNAFFYYLNVGNPRIMHASQVGAIPNRRGEYWIYAIHQMLARYNMERLSHGLGTVDELSFYGIVKTGYDPQLISYSGNGFTYRKNYFEIQSYQNFELANKVVNLERRILDIIDTGKFVTKTGEVIDLSQPQAIEYVGNLLLGTMDVLDRKFFGYWFTFYNNYISGEDFETYYIQPNVLLNFETMLRDPISYQLFKTIVNVFYKFKNQFPPYTHEELLMPGVKIVDAEVTKLKTYFDLVDTDVTNLLNDKMVFHEGKFYWDKTLLARQLRLNHKPFDFTLKVQSDKAQKVVVRTFYSPSFDEYGQKLEILYTPENFVQLDQFVYDLSVGENFIKRSSVDFYYTVSDQTTYTELYKYVMLAYEGKQEYSPSIVQPYCGFPDRLILPRGHYEGLPIKMFFMVTPYNGSYELNQPLTCGFGSGMSYYDNLPFGYPFDRKVYSPYDFVVPNMMFIDAKIYHSEKYERYYPFKYEKYGSFDHTY